MRTVVVYSGGLDSTVLLYHLRDAGHTVHALFADYGQRHGPREWAAAQGICADLGVPLERADLSPLAALFGRNALSDAATPVPAADYSDTASIQQTTVPNRNMVLLSLALGRAAALGFDAAAYGAHGGAYTNYPDCTPAFAGAMDSAARQCDWRPLRVLAPFVTWTKADIVRRGLALGVPLERTWSCYAGGERPCEVCGTCRDRAAAFAEAGASVHPNE